MNPIGTTGPRQPRFFVYFFRCGSGVEHCRTGIPNSFFISEYVRTCFVGQGSRRSSGGYMFFMEETMINMNEFRESHVSKWTIGQSIVFREN